MFPKLIEKMLAGNIPDPQATIQPEIIAAPAPAAPVSIPIIDVPVELGDATRPAALVQGATFGPIVEGAPAVQQALTPPVQVPAYIPVPGMVSVPAPLSEKIPIVAPVVDAPVEPDSSDVTFDELKNGVMVLAGFVGRLIDDIRNHRVLEFFSDATDNGSFKTLNEIAVDVTEIKSKVGGR